MVMVMAIISLGREDLLNVQNAANLLQIKLNNLNVEPSNKVAPKIFEIKLKKTSIHIQMCRLCILKWTAMRPSKTSTIRYNSLSLDYCER